MRAVNIKWDQEDYDIIILPTELDIPDGMTDEDEISEYLCNVTGYCHKGFDLERDE